MKALMACGDPVANVGVELRPPVMASDKLLGSKPTWVSSCRAVVESLDDGESQSVVLWNMNPSSVAENAIFIRPVLMVENPIGEPFEGFDGASDAILRRRSQILQMPSTEGVDVWFQVACANEEFRLEKHLIHVVVTAVVVVCTSG